MDQVSKQATSSAFVSAEFATIMPTWLNIADAGSVGHGSMGHGTPLESGLGRFREGQPLFAERLTDFGHRAWSHSMEFKKFRFRCLGQLPESRVTGGVKRPDRGFCQTSRKSIVGFFGSLLRH